MIEVKIEDNVVIFHLNVTNRPMNVISADFINAMEEIVETYYVKEHSYAGFIFTSSRPEFLAGADLSLLKDITSTEECLQITHRLHRCMRLIEKKSLPTIAAINGVALGGGLELALTCHHIIAIDDKKVKVGLPEVTLGLLPGGGGTQRLPRMIGFEAALPLLLQGQVINAAKAKELGIIHELVPNASELIAKAKEYIKKNPEVMKAWDNSKFKLPGPAIQSPRGYQFFPATVAMLMEKTWFNYPAPQNIIKCVYEGLQLPFDQALEVEERYFAELVVSPIAKNMIRTLFFSINECKKGKGRPELPITKIQKVGILGAGMMGAGIAFVSAKAKMQVVLKDVKQEAASKGKAYSEKFSDKDLLDRIEATTRVDKMHDCDLIIEAVIEDRNIKKAVISETEKVIRSNCIFASNTSTLPITSLATYSERPKNFIGLHFFSPVDKMGLVEIILGKETSPEALALCLDYVNQIGKTPIVVNDSRGFYTSRVFTTYISEGISALIEGVSGTLIDNAGKACGMAVGPLTVADEVSIDLIYHILKQTKDDTGLGKDDQRTFDLTQKFIEVGRLGKKSAKGFFDYSEAGKSFSSEVKALYPTTQTDYPLEEMKLRLLTRQAVESVRCLDEGVLRSVEEADVGSILGWGFPAYTGGTLSYIDYRGIDQFIKDCEMLTKKFGDRFKAPASLYERQKQQKKFHA